MKKIYFIRHGETMANIEKRYSSTGGSPLTEKGKSQVDRLMDDFSKIRIEVVYSSPLDRCTYLSERLCEAKGLIPVIDENLREYGFGVLDNLTWHEAAEKQPDVFEKFCESTLTYKIPGGESLAEFNERVNSFLTGLLKDDRPAAVVTHAGVIRSALAILLGLDEKQRWIYKIRNCSVTLVEVRDGHASLVLTEGL